MDQQQNILQIENLSKYFGGLAAVSDCSLKIKKGSITAVSYTHLTLPTNREV